MKYEQKVQVETSEYICFVKRIDGVVAQKTLEQELIRCKDCHWHYGTICRRNNTMFWEDEDFCSLAERKEE